MRIAGMYFTELLAIVVICWCARKLVENLVKNMLDAKSAGRDLGAAERILSVVCDAVFYLDSHSVIQSSSATMAALLLVPDAKKLRGKSIYNYMPNDSDKTKV